MREETAASTSWTTHYKHHPKGRIVHNTAFISPGVGNPLNEVVTQGIDSDCYISVTSTRYNC